MHELWQPPRAPLRRSHLRTHHAGQGKHEAITDRVGRHTQRVARERQPIEGSRFRIKMQHEMLH